MDFSIQFTQNGLESIRSGLASIGGLLRSRFVPSVASPSSIGGSYLGAAIQIAAGTITSGLALRFAEDIFQRLFEREVDLKKKISVTARLLSFFAYETTKQHHHFTATTGEFLSYLRDIFKENLKKLMDSFKNDLQQPISILNTAKIKTFFSETLPSFISGAVNLLIGGLGRHIINFAAGFKELFTAFFDYFGGVNIVKKIGAGITAALAAVITAVGAIFVKIASALTPAVVSSIIKSLASNLAGLLALGAIYMKASIILAAAVPLLHRRVQEYISEVLLSTIDFMNEKIRKIKEISSEAIGAFRVGLAKITKDWGFVAEEQLIRADEMQHRISPSQIREYRLIETIDERMRGHWEKLIEKLEIIDARARRMFEQQNMQIDEVIQLQRRRELALLYGR